MRNVLILLMLVAVTATTAGCTRCRNLFRRGSPCCGTSTVAPAMMGAPVAISAPTVAAPPTRVIPQVVPQVVPQIMTPQVVVPQQQVPCCPQVCPPCATPCVPCDPCRGCEQGCVGATGEWFGGYVGDATCPNCGPTTTYEGDYAAPLTNTYTEDPRPTGEE